MNCIAFDVDVFLLTLVSSSWTIVLADFYITGMVTHTTTLRPFPFFIPFLSFVHLASLILF